MTPIETKHMKSIEKNIAELAAYLKDNMLTKTEFKEAMADIDERFDW